MALDFIVNDKPCLAMGATHETLELYALVWEKPWFMSQSTSAFPTSDYERFCVRHDIPAPHWAIGPSSLMARRSCSRRSPLLKSDIRDQIFLIVRSIREVPENVCTPKSSAQSENSAPENHISVPTERPEKLHQHAAAVEKVLRKAKPDHEGFVSCSGPELIASELVRDRWNGRSPIDAFMKALTRARLLIEDHEGDLRIIVENRAFRVFGLRDQGQEGL